jgi:hypothetical protein
LTTTELAHLLRNLSPQLAKESWVFCSVPEMPETLPCKPLMSFHESEGVTLVVPKSAAESLHLGGSGPYRQIILTVQSSLEAVGLTAAVSSALAGAGISCNIVAAFHHDHLFVRDIDAERALGVLEILSKADVQGTSVRQRRS